MTETTDQRPGLKPCPCCGADAEYIQTHYSMHRIRCIECGLHSNVYRRREEAVKAWNRRTP